MKMYLLDAGGAGLLVAFIALGILFLFIAILLEAIIMTVFKYNVFKKAFLHSLIVNVASLCVGFILQEFFSDGLDTSQWVILLILYGVTLVVETPLLYAMNRSKPLFKAIQVSLVMNFLTYIILYLFSM
ncbi:MAG: hypothetical protein IPP93_18410 [Chitinophagaceae bacterium]|nr:hypothetical protein [Chitinophagaceae bacterium]